MMLALDPDDRPTADALLAHAFFADPEADRRAESLSEEEGGRITVSPAAAAGSGGGGDLEAAAASGDTVPSTLPVEAARRAESVSEEEDGAEEEAEEGGEEEGGENAEGALAAACVALSTDEDAEDEEEAEGKAAACVSVSMDQEAEEEDIDVRGSLAGHGISMNEDAATEDEDGEDGEEEEEDDEEDDQEEEEEEEEEGNAAARDEGRASFQRWVEGVPTEGSGRVRPPSIPPLNISALAPPAPAVPSVDDLSPRQSPVKNLSPTSSPAEDEVQGWSSPTNGIPIGFHFPSAESMLARFPSSGRVDKVDEGAATPPPQPSAAGDEDGDRSSAGDEVGDSAVATVVLRPWTAKSSPSSPETRSMGDIQSASGTSASASPPPPHPSASGDITPSAILHAAGLETAGSSPSSSETRSVGDVRSPSGMSVGDVRSPSGMSVGVVWSPSGMSVGDVRSPSGASPRPPSRASTASSDRGQARSGETGHPRRTSPTETGHPRRTSAGCSPPSSETRDVRFPSGMTIDGDARFPSPEDPSPRQSPAEDLSPTSSPAGSGDPASASPPPPHPSASSDRGQARSGVTAPPPSRRASTVESSAGDCLGDRSSAGDEVGDRSSRACADTLPAPPTPGKVTHVAGLYPGTDGGAELPGPPSLNGLAQRTEEQRAANPLTTAAPARPEQMDRYFIAGQPAPAPHQGRAAFTHVDPLPRAASHPSGDSAKSLRPSYTGLSPQNPHDFIPEYMIPGHTHPDPVSRETGDCQGPVSGSMGDWASLFAWSIVSEPPPPTGGGTDSPRAYSRTAVGSAGGASVGGRAGGSPISWGKGFEATGPGAQESSYGPTPGIPGYSSPTPGISGYSRSRAVEGKGGGASFRAWVSEGTAPVDGAAGGADVRGADGPADGADNAGGRDDNAGGRDDNAGGRDGAAGVGARSSEAVRALFHLKNGASQGHNLFHQQMAQAKARIWS